jgi:CheY-like chemotaxis protein
MNILLVDDDMDDQQLIHEALTSLDSTVNCTFAGNGEEALAVLSQVDRKPDLILLDINMPRLDGRECLRTIRRDPQLSHLEVIIISTAISKEDAMLFEMLHTRYIVKPSSFQQLLEVLSDCLRGCSREMGQLER